MHAWIRPTLILSLVALHQGCGGSDSGGGGTGSTARVNSGLPPATSVSDLSDAEARQLCNSFATATQQAVSDRQYCTFFAVVENLTPSADGSSLDLDSAACTTSAQQCIASGEQFIDPDCSTASAAEVSGCDVTVSEFEQCWNAQLAMFSRMMSSVTCDRAPTARQVETFDPDATAPECEGVAYRCPDLLGSDSASGGGSTQEPSPTGCDDTCVDASDGFCDDGGPGSDTPICGLGTDCSDCGERPPPT